MPPAPIAAGASPTSQIGDLLTGGMPGQDQVQAQIEALASQIRDIVQMTDPIALDFPAAAQEIAQVRKLLMQIVVKAAELAPQTTPSAGMVPTGGTMGAGPV